MKERYRVALLGGGGRGRLHAAAFLANADRFEVVAICDKDPERLAAYHGRLHQLAPRIGSVRQYGDAEQMLSEVKPDVFSFVTLPDARLELVELGVAHGVAAIEFEKPMALSLDEARRIRDVCDRAGVKAIVSHQHKYGEHWREAKQIVERGELGDVHTIHATSKGWLLIYGTHLIDSIMFLNDWSRGEWVVGHVHGSGKLGDSHPSPDYIMAQVEFANGARGILECGDLAPSLSGDLDFWVDAGVTVYGSEGWLRVFVGDGWQAVTRSSGGLISGPGQLDAYVDQPPYIAELADWLDDDEMAHSCRLDRAYHGFEIVTAACLSGLERRRIDLPLEPGESVIERMRREL